MRLTAIFLFVASLHVSAKGYSQITLSETNAPLQKIFKEIKKQSGYDFLFSAKLIEQAGNVTVKISNVSLQQAIEEILKGKDLVYEILEKTVIIKKKEEAKEMINIALPPADVHGRVTDSSGNPLVGASVNIKGSRKGTSTDVNGNFELTNVKENATILISYTGYETREYKINGMVTLNIILNRLTSQLDAVQVIPYGTVTARLNTGNVTTVTSKEIEMQPVTNALAALEGRVPGLQITQSTGLPGGGFKVQIQGRNSIINGTDPYYVIDGVPYNSQIGGIVYNEQSAGALINRDLKGGSPLNYLNPNDIESIEILKDADATAIYGSRAANGAILITTKKGKLGAMKFDFSVKYGQSKRSRDFQMLNTQQYLAMRHEAFANDGATPQSYDHDINGDWDTTRYTNWSKVFDGTGTFMDAEAGISGGNANTQYLIGFGYNRQTSGFPVVISNAGIDQKPSVHFNLSSATSNKRFKINFSGNYLSDLNTLAISPNSSSLFLQPDTPPIYNADGTLNWAPVSPGQTGTWLNPYSYFLTSLESKTRNLIANTLLSYTILKGLDVRASLGYTNTGINEVRTTPTTSFDPGRNRTSGFSTFNNINSNSWIVEPYVNYNVQVGPGRMTALVGLTFQESDNATLNQQADGFSNDALLKNIGSASHVGIIASEAQYKYQAVYGRLNYNLQDKYLLNITARRDGSSRFGPGKQFANFGAVGAGWIFSSENSIQKALPFLSFGKIRMSYGITGNDQVGDYQYLDLYTTTQYAYQGLRGFYPVSLFNPELAWETTDKWEGGIELGFVKDRILLQVNFFKNKTDNQLVQSPISQVTGFAQIPANLPATVENRGLEVLLNTINIKTLHFTWSSSINLTIARNKLLSFPNLENSTYATSLIIGKPVTILRRYSYGGINDSLGVYEFKSPQGGNTLNPVYPVDYTGLIDVTPRYYGGFSNSLTYKGFSLDFLFQFVKQEGKAFWSDFSVQPGTGFNLPVDALNRWQKPGDQAKYQKFSQAYNDAATAFSYANSSTFAYNDASFIRLKNISLSWMLPTNWRSKMHMDNCRLYVQAQNLFTITNYTGIDPESQGTGYPPLKTWVGGFQITF